jgi:hypothetical protein
VFELKIFGGRPVAPIQFYDYTAAFATDVFTATGWVPVNGKTVAFVSGPFLPAGGRCQKAVLRGPERRSTFKISLTSGGAAVDLTADGDGQFIVREDTVEGTDTLAGFDEWMEWKAREFLHAMKVTARSSDWQAHNEQRILAMQKADDLFDKYRMAKEDYTEFVTYGGGGW